MGAAGLAVQLSSFRALSGAADPLAWQREAKFGMFIHWGPYSVAGVEASWPIMVPTGEISEAEYRALPDRFNPVRFDPKEWIDLARKCGQRYMVFTAKHHDGFCMFDSEYTNYKITRTPYGKDIVRQLADACRSEQMPLGFYYSPPDMNHPGYRNTSELAKTNYRGEPERPEWPLYLEYMNLQLHELLTKYGPVAEVWFDAVDPEAQARYDGQRFVDEVRRLQPTALLNNRMGVPGDFATPEQFIPKAIPVKGIQMDSADHRGADKQKIKIPRPEDFQPWETCMTINETWAYRPQDRNFKNVDTLIRSLIEIISRGGNLLLDVGPQPDGQIQSEFIERLEAVGDWTHRNAAAIYGSTYGPIQGEASFRTTERGNSIYVFAMDSSAEDIRVEGLHQTVSKVQMVATGKPVAFTAAAGGVRIPNAKGLWTNGIPVIELRR
jgi:alpha-L-fucosidase